MPDFPDWCAAGIFCVALLLLTFSVYVVYSGLLAKISISTGSSPVKSMTVAYKYREGPYKESGLLFAESWRLAPELPTVGIFYDDPKKVPGPKCRSAVGSILSEGDQRPSAELQELYEKFGFRIFTFPEVTHVVSACFPYRTRHSIILGLCRVYPQLNCYIKDRKLCAHPFLEIYRDRLIYYMSPLAKQGDFYVPEVQKAPKRQEEGEESEEDRRTDITDSHSECSSVSGLLQSHSRDTSPALSRSTSVRYHQRRDSLSDSDSGKRKSRRSSSASSFEDLLLEADKCGTSDSPEDAKLHPQHPGLMVKGEE